MSDPKDGPWDDATAHDDASAYDSEQMDGEDPPTTRATLAQQVRMRSAARNVPGATAPAVGAARTSGSTLPPPSSPERLLTHATQTPVTTASASASTARTGTSAASARPAPADGDVIALDKVARTATPPVEAPGRSETSAGGILVVATGADGERVRRLCHANGLLVPVLASLGAAHESAMIVVLGEPSLPAPPQVAYIARTALGDDELLDLLRGLVAGRVVVEPPAAAADADPRVGEYAQRIASLHDRGAIETLAIEAITALVRADRAQLLLFDPLTGALWSEAKRQAGGDRDRRAAAGLVGWCAHTGHAVHASPAGDDSRYLVEIDDPEGKAQTRILVQPVIGADRRTHAVLVATRRWRHDDFVDADRVALRSLAACIAPAIDLATAGVAAVDPRRQRGTLPGVAATQSAAPAMQSAVLAAPSRVASDSRPPPLTARRADSQPPPLAAKRPVPAASTAAPPDSPGISGASIPVAVAHGHGGAEPRRVDAHGQADSSDRARQDAAASPGISGASIPIIDAHEAAGRGSPDSAPSRAPSEPSRTRNPSDPPSSRKARAGHASDPLDVAIVATADDDIARIQRIARKARLEVSVLSRAEDAPPYYRIVTLGETWSADSDTRIAYAARSTITDDQLAELLVGLSQDRAPAALIATKPHNAAEARRVQVAFTGSRKLATAADLAEAEASLIATVREVVDADRAYCVYYESEDGALWSEHRRRARGDDRRAIAGVAGWSARTGRPANIPRASADPRWLGPLDDPDGDMHSQLLVQPIIAADRRVIGVVIAARRTKRPPFTELDVSVLENLVALTGPFIDQLQLAAVTHQLLRESGAQHDVAALDSPVQTLLRRVRVLPRWTYAAGGGALMLLVVLVANC